MAVRFRLKRVEIHSVSLEPYESNKKNKWKRDILSKNSKWFLMFFTKIELLNGDAVVIII